MRFWTLFLSLNLLAVVPASGRPLSDYYQGQLDSLRTVIYDRAKLLADKHGFSWNPDSLPNVAIGLPDHMKVKYKVLQPFCYAIDTRTIWINPIIIVRPDSLEDLRLMLFRELYGTPTGFMKELDHELVHWKTADAYTQSTGLRVPLVLVAQEVTAQFERDFLWEGLARSVEGKPLPVLLHDDLWPESLPLGQATWFVGTPLWITTVYEGGHQAVGPLVASFGLQPTIDYVVRHPLRITDNQVRVAVWAWRRQAWVDLSTTPNRTTK